MGYLKDMSMAELNEATIKRYIEEQESHDIAMDKLGIKDYDDLNRNTDITDCYGNRTTYEYDKYSQLIKTVDAKGMVVQALLNCALTAVLGEAATTMLKVVGVVQDAGSFIAAVKSGDPEQIIVESLRLDVSVFSLSCQCFTWDALVITDGGDKRIDEVEPGDFVWAYDTETEEKELKQVVEVPVTETDILVYVTTSDGQEIKTTMSILSFLFTGR